MINKALLALGIAALASTASYAAAPKSVALSADKTKVFALTSGKAGFTPYYKHPASTVIFSNLATKYPKGVYFAGEGYTIAGPDAGLGGEYWAAGGFTPAASATATVVEAGVGYVEGTATITLSIYSDSNGAPGTVLWSGVAKDTQTFGGCCGVVKATIKGGLALTGGTPYWVAVTTDKKETNTFSAWNIATTDQVDEVPAAYNDNDAGWTSYSTTLPPAFGVFTK